MHLIKKGIYLLLEERLKVLQEYLNKELSLGKIRELQSPVGYPIIFIPKKDGSLRLCVDYQNLNYITIKNSYSLLLISKLQDRLQGAQWFTTLNILNAYNRIRIKEEDEWKTIFRTRYSYYKYLVMLFGLTNTPTTF